MYVFTFCAHSIRILESQRASFPLTRWPSPSVGSVSAGAGAWLGVQLPHPTFEIHWSLLSASLLLLTLPPTTPISLSITVYFTLTISPIKSSKGLGSEKMTFGVLNQIPDAGSSLTRRKGQWEGWSVDSRMQITLLGLILNLSIWQQQLFQRSPVRYRILSAVCQALQTVAPINRVWTCSPGNQVPVLEDTHFLCLFWCLTSTCCHPTHPTYPGWCSRGHRCCLWTFLCLYLSLWHGWCFTYGFSN